MGGERMSELSVSTSSSLTDLAHSRARQSMNNTNSRAGRVSTINEYKKRLSEMAQTGRGPNDKTRSVFENIRMVFAHQVFGRKNRRFNDGAKFYPTDPNENLFNEVTKVVAVDNIYHMSPKSVFFRDA